MFPVSGALQLKGSAPIGERPMISHRGAYSRLGSVMNRFQSPWARALPLSSSTIFVAFHGSPAARFAATSA
jgi:hypothetical protein